MYANLRKASRDPITAVICAAIPTQQRSKSLQLVTAGADQNNRGYKAAYGPTKLPSETFLPIVRQVREIPGWKTALRP